ncbi:glycosyltransferase family 1 protein [Exilibacterium tricleocarpae]|uniref:Glycosyltransferase family 1 protein n=1 Tax=Exilibacterium tricleocarpae TaxID=2591008 RepID=A0A545TK97_9GAMM|nr:glycosyltransferase [Exilibacterium tricleocarpae]TQV77649.1 glycosyltransferase family 1 protein [Exilibacterium tricleocarpae]
MRVLHIAYQQLRRYGHTRVSWAQKLFFGLIKNGHYVQGFSDRDVAAFEAPLGIRDLGYKKANKRLLEMAEALQPDLVVVGHCDIIQNRTLEDIRRLLPAVAIAGCNNDPLFIPDNVRKIEQRCAVVDAMFVSTGHEALKQFEGRRARLFHMPNPVDGAIENQDASNRQNLPIDLIYCSNALQHTKRLEDVGYLRQQLNGELVFKTFGSFGEKPVWGRDYDRALGQSKMGLNFNRQEGWHWYSSARIAQLGGNGLLIFTNADAGFDTLFPDRTLVYYRDLDHLLGLIREFHADDDKRRAWAAATRHFFHTEMNSTLNAQYILESTLGIDYSHPYVWLEQ